jgi:hypothetical protein
MLRTSLDKTSTLNLRQDVLCSYHECALSAITHKLIFPDTCRYELSSLFLYVKFMPKICPRRSVTLCIYGWVEHLGTGRGEDRNMETALKRAVLSKWRYRKNWRYRWSCRATGAVVSAVRDERGSTVN